MQNAFFHLTLILLSSGDPVETKCELEGCEVGKPGEGEVCDIEGGMVQEALAACALAPKDGSIELDKWLFNQLSEAIFLGEKENALYRCGCTTVSFHLALFVCRPCHSEHVGRGQVRQACNLQQPEQKSSSRKPMQLSNAAW
jgi:hypothetical protein